MIRVLEEAIAKIRELPKERQVAAAGAIEVIAAQSDNKLSPAEIAGVKKAQRAVRAGKYASDRRVKSFFARFHA